MSRKDWLKSNVKLTEDTLCINGFQVMQKWETPIMKLLAKKVCKSKGKILEVDL